MSLNLAQWLQIVGPVLTALVANFLELRKLRQTIGQLVIVADERHAKSEKRLDGHEKRIDNLEARG